jgi:lipopolysaccharide/colanic/teichoic acid biosynthesis glycosyltransferase
VSQNMRIFDRLMCVLSTPILLPVFALIACAILLDDGTPVLFLQQRVGRARKVLGIYKFRSMRGEKVTRIGQLLRVTGLDETAQWFNVWRGDMSWIGPRPLTKKDIARLGWDHAAHDLRFSLRPGMTGLAQLYGGVSASWTRPGSNLSAQTGFVSESLDCRTFAGHYAAWKKTRARFFVEQAVMRTLIGTSARSGFGYP